MKKLLILFGVIFFIFLQSCKSNTDPTTGGGGGNTPLAAVSVAEFNTLGTFGTIGAGSVTAFGYINTFDVTPATANSYSKPLWFGEWGKSGVQNDACLAFSYGSDIPFDMDGTSISRKVNIADAGNYDITFDATGGFGATGSVIFGQAAIDGGAKVWASWVSGSGWASYKISLTGISAGEHTFTITFTSKNTADKWFNIDNIKITKVP